MEKDIIKKLKDPEQCQPYGYRSKEEREALDVAGPGNMLVLLEHMFIWHPCLKELDPIMGLVYILKPEYVPEYIVE